MKFCSKCGNPLDNTKKFCNKCGAPNSFFVAATPTPATTSDNDLAKLQLQKEQIEREMERKALEETKRKEELRLAQEKEAKETLEKLNQEKARKEAIERENLERLNKQRENEAARQKEQQLEELLKQQNKEEELRKKERLIEEQSEILQKVKLERELLQREIDKIAQLRMQSEQLTKKTPAVPPQLRAAPDQPVQKSNAAKRALIIFVVLLVFAAIGAGAFFAYQKFMIVDNYQQAINEINAHQWSSAAQDLKQTAQNNNGLPSSKQRSADELANISIWQTGLAQIAVAIQYPGILLSGNKPAVKDYINVLARFKKIPFNNMLANVLTGVNAGSAFAPVYVLHDSVELGLMQMLLQQPEKLSVQKESLVYNDGPVQFNMDSLDADLMSKTDPALSTWYNQILAQKTKALEALIVQPAGKTKPEPQAYHAPKPKWTEAKKTLPAEQHTPVQSEAPKRNAD